MEQLGHGIDLRNEPEGTSRTVIRSRDVSGFLRDIFVVRLYEMHRGVGQGLLLISEAEKRRVELRQETHYHISNGWIEPLTLLSMLYFPDFSIMSRDCWLSYH